MSSTYLRPSAERGRTISVESRRQRAGVLVQRQPRTAITLPSGSVLGLISVTAPTREPPILTSLPTTSWAPLGHLGLDLVGRDERQALVGVVGQEDGDEDHQHRRGADQHGVARDAAAARSSSAAVLAEEVVQQRVGRVGAGSRASASARRGPRRAAPRSRPARRVAAGAPAPAGSRRRRRRRLGRRPSARTPGPARRLALARLDFARASWPDGRPARFGSAASCCLTFSTSWPSARASAIAVARSTGSSPAASIALVVAVAAGRRRRRRPGTSPSSPRPASARRSRTG